MCKFDCFLKNLFSFYLDAQPMPRPCKVIHMHVDHLGYLGRPKPVNQPCTNPSLKKPATRSGMQSHAFPTWTKAGQAMLNVD